MTPSETPLNPELDLAGLEADVPAPAQAPNPAAAPAPNSAPAPVTTPAPSLDPVQVLAERQAQLEKQLAEALAAKQQQQVPEATVADVPEEQFREEVALLQFTDPIAAYRKIQERDAAIRQRTEQAQAERVRKANQELYSIVPEAVELGEKPELQAEFNKFLGANPLLKAIYDRAGQNLDVEGRAFALKQFYDTVKATQGQAAANVPVGNQQQALQALKGAIPSATATAPSQGKVQMLSRAKIQNLLQTNRAEYERLLPEINKARMEGRITS